MFDSIVIFVLMYYSSVCFTTSSRTVKIQLCLFLENNSSYNNMVPPTIQFPQQHSFPNSTVSPTTQFLQQHSFPNNTVSSTAQFLQQHNSPNSTVSPTAQFPQQHSSPNNTVSPTTQFPQQHSFPVPTTTQLPFVLCLLTIFGILFNPIVPMLNSQAVIILK